MLLAAMILGAAIRALAADSPIVDARWLDARRAAGSLVVAEVSWAPAAKANEYNAAHLPGAIHINTDVFENGSPRWHLRPVAELHAALGELGITANDTVVVYSHQSTAAARVWWVMEYAGVKDIRYLNGGLASWRGVGLPVDATPTVLARTRFHATPRVEVLADTRYVQQLRDGILVDVRSRREFTGEVSGYSYIDAKGRIPGARAAGNASDSARLYQNADGSLRDLDEIREMWRAAGVLDGRELVFYCGGGWRSSLAFLYARAMGLRARNYSDGWSAWSTIYEPVGQEWRQRPSANPVARDRWE